jgi:tetratricopeptide (TPR) repeat protein
VAAVVGREFELDVLRQVLARPVEELEEAIEEASAAGIIEERSIVGTTITYRFTHAFFRQTLYDEIVAPRRIRLHQQVARAVEEIHPGRLDEHAAELAEHYAFSSDILDLAKAVRYGELAAKLATDVFAYGEAARQLERALVVHELVDPEDKGKRCELLLALGEALLRAGEPGRVIAYVAPEALALARALGDRSRAFRACHIVLECFHLQGAATSTRLPEYLQWAEQARGYANPDSIERVLADLALAAAWNSRGRAREARELRLEALGLSRRLDDPETLARSALFVLRQGPPQLWGERLHLAEESVTWPREGVRSRALGSLLWYSARLLLAHGERARAEELWRQVHELAERTRVASVDLLVPRRDVILAIVDGHLETAVASLRRFVERADESGAAVSSRQFNLSMLHAPVIYLGRAGTWLAAFDEFAELAGPASQAVEFTAARAVCLAHLGRLEEARALVGTYLERIEAGVDEGETHMYLLVWLLEAAVLVGDERAARTLSERLDCVAHLSIGEGF